MARPIVIWFRVNELPVYRDMFSPMIWTGRSVPPVSSLVMV